MPVSIRPMTTADVAPAAAAVLRGDWGDRASWFRFAVEHPSCRPVVAVDRDVVIGTGVGTCHGAAGWIGTIWVAPERRGEGLGRELSRVVADGLEAVGCRTLLLAATPAGRPVYERLGFVETDEYVALEHAGPSAGRADAATMRDGGVGPDTRRCDLTAADLAEVIALDRAATGEDRSAVLRALVADQGTTGGLVLRGAGGDLRGLLLRGPWPGGATIAREPADALSLVRTRLAAHPDGRVVTGLLASNQRGLAAFATEGWTELRRVTRMARGEPLDWRPDWIFGQLNFALG